ncbi:MAG: hypothetical protein ACRD1A_10670 [Terriglobales bacterium]
MLRWLPLFCLGALALVSVPHPAASAPPVSPALQKLDVSAGRWVFHGQQLHTRSGKPSPWTWNQDCRWSPNHLYLECTFSNTWGGRQVESLVVDTYNTADHTYWHYELYAAGDNGSHPFISKMTIAGNTWTEQGLPSATGQPARERVVYHWQPPDRVTVAIETTRDGTHWTTVDEGTGKKEGR